jgi:formate hydrogenlyase transcriptional activator
LQNVIERSVIVSDTDEFTVDESWLSTRPAVENGLGLPRTLAAHEKALIEDALRASGGRGLGLGRPHDSEFRVQRLDRGFVP